MLSRNYFRVQELIKQSPKNGKSTRELTFNSGETNPLLFLTEFQKCSDIETDQDKTYKIRDFVDHRHKRKKLIFMLFVRDEG